MFDRAINYEMARECDRNPNVPLASIAAELQDRLSDAGVPQAAIRATLDDPNLRNRFLHRLVPNPAYWEKVLSRRFCFYSVEAPANRYLELLELLGDIPDISHYVCYGELDVLVRVLATDADADEIEQFLVRHGFSIRTLRVERTIFYAGFPTEQIPRKLRPPVAAETIDDALAADIDSLDPSLVDQLNESAITLGAVYYEDHRFTGRLRAFMGVRLRDHLNTSGTQQFEHKLFGINEYEMEHRGSEPLISIYRCSSTRYSYLLQMICDDHKQLDELTDYIQTLHDAVWDTVTYIVAKHHDHPVLFSDRRREVTDNFAIASGLLEATVTPLTEALRADLPSSLSSDFRVAAPKTQFDILKLYDDILLSSPYESPANKDILKPYFMDFVKGVLDHKPSTIKNAALAMIRDEVEDRHTHFAAAIVDNFFGGEAGRLQSELGTRQADWKRWGLVVWADHIYPAWNKHPTLSKVLEIEPEALETLRYLGSTRNSFAHVRDSIPEEELIHAVRETFHHVYRFLNWVEEARPQVLEPRISLVTFWRALAEDRKCKLLDGVREIKNLQFETLDTLAVLQKTDDGRWADLITRVQDIENGIARIDDDLIEDLRTSILPALQASDRTVAQRTLDYIQSSAAALPPGITGSLLAAMISKAAGA